MEFLNNLRLRWHEFVLRKRIKRKRVSHHSIGIQKANKIGILFDATQDENSIFVDNYARILRKHGKKVECLAYIDDLEEHDTPHYAHFNKKDLSWYLHPKKETAHQFMDTKFDILLCLFTNPVLPLEYISALSSANFRVGHYSDDKLHCYDLMIDNTDGNDLQKFIGEVDQRLKIFN